MSGHVSMVRTCVPLWVLFLFLFLLGMGRTLRVGEPVGRHGGWLGAMRESVGFGVGLIVYVRVVGARGLKWGVVVACVFSSHR
jgi:hypothetical protein